MTVAIATIAITVFLFALFVLVGLIARRSDRLREGESHTETPQNHH